MRNYGLELKGEIATVLSIVGLYSSLLMSGFSITAPKNITRYTLAKIIFLTLIPTIVFLISYDFFVIEYYISKTLLISYAFLHVINLLTNILFVIRRRYIPLIISSLGIPLALLVASIRELDLTSNFVFIMISITYFIALVSYYTLEPPKNASQKGYLDTLKDYAESFQLTPYAFLSSAPIHISILYLIKNLGEIAIFSIIISISQISIKFTRNIQIQSLNTLQISGNKYDLLFHIMLISMLTLAGAGLMHWVYNISAYDFGYPLVLILLSNVFVLNITNADSKMINEDNIIRLTLFKLISFAFFVTTYLSIPSINELDKVSISILVARLINSIVARPITGRII